MNNQSAICIYGASSDDIAPAFKSDAFRVGELIASAGCTLVCGGGRAGLMRAAIDGALKAGGTAWGVLPQFMIEKKWQHPGLSDVIVTETMHQRKHKMASLSFAAIAFPGGCGTYEELLELITWRQLNLWRGNIVILNSLGYYDDLIAQLHKSLEMGFMRPEHEGLFSVASSPEQAVELALRPVEKTVWRQKID